MNPFAHELSDPLLKKIQGNWGGFSALDDEGKEILSTSLDPELKFEPIFYDAERQTWEQDGEGECFSELCINSDHYAFFTRADDLLGPFIESTINSTSELQEFISLFTRSKIKQITSAKLSPRSLNQIVESTHLLFWHEGKPLLFPNNPQLLKDISPEIFKTFDICLGGKPIEDIYRPYYDPTDEARYLKLWNKIAPHCLEARPSDIEIGADGSISYLENFGENVEDYPYESPSLILRLNQKSSSMWFYDYLKYAKEAETLTWEILKSWTTLNKFLKTTQIDTFSTITAQTARAIELRNSRRLYQEAVESCLSIREPFSSIENQFTKRTKVVKQLHTELLDDVVAMQSPLPYFLEFPYQAYRKEDDPILKIRAAQRLLGLLIKIPLFLIVEELLAQNSNSGLSSIEKIKGSDPLSDGALLGILKEITKSSEIAELEIFKPLKDALLDAKPWDKLVELRNRMHHEPYDEEGFISAMLENVPIIIDKFRSALSGIAFIIPKSSQYRKPDILVEAENICNSDHQFRTVEFKTTLSIESFPTDQLIAYHSESNIVVSIENLITSKLVTKTARDFGIFDRIHKENPIYSYLRSD